MIQLHSEYSTTCCSCYLSKLNPVGQAQEEELDMAVSSKNVHKASNNQVLAVTETVSSPIFQKEKVVGGRGHVRAHIVVSFLFSLESAKVFIFCRVSDGCFS